MSRDRDNLKELKREGYISSNKDEDLKNNLKYNVTRRRNAEKEANELKKSNDFLILDKRKKIIAISIIALFIITTGWLIMKDSTVSIIINLDDYNPESSQVSEYENLNLTKIDIYFTKEQTNYSTIHDLKSYLTQTIENTENNHESIIDITRGYNLVGMKFYNETENKIEVSSSLSEISIVNMTYPEYLVNTYNETFGFNVPYNYTIGYDSEGNYYNYFYNFSLDPSQNVYSNSSLVMRNTYLNATSVQVIRGTQNLNNYQATWKNDSVLNGFRSIGYTTEEPIPYEIEQMDIKSANNIKATGITPTPITHYIYVKYNFDLPTCFYQCVNPYMYQNISVIQNAYYSRTPSLGNEYFDGSSWKYTNTQPQTKEYKFINAYNYLDFINHKFYVSFYAYMSSGFSLFVDDLHLNLTYIENITSYYSDGEQINMYVNGTTFGSGYNYTGNGLQFESINLNKTDVFDIGNLITSYNTTNNVAVETKTEGFIVENIISLNLLIGNEFLNISLTILITIRTEILIIENSIIKYFDNLEIGYFPYLVEINGIDFNDIDIDMSIESNFLLMFRDLWYIITGKWKEST